MADEVKHISEINLDNISYAIKDSAAREALAALQALFENSLDIDCGTATENVE